MKNTLTLLWVLIGWTALAAEQSSSSLSDDALLQIKFDQKLNDAVSIDLPFRDESGNSVPLGNYFGRRPVILVLGYYECPMLCSLVLNGLIEAMQDLKLDAGKEFEVVNVSIDPRETPTLALAKKRIYLKRYGRHGAEAGWHFLTGDGAAIQALADEVGFRFAYDPRAKQFAHPSGIVILTADGKVSRYLFGVTFSAKELDSALHDAGAKKIGSPVQQLLLLCFHYSPVTGKYGNLVMNGVRVSAFSTVAVLGIVLMRRSRRREEADCSTHGSASSRRRLQRAGEAR
jgi:protein SCO1/2